MSGTLGITPIRQVGALAVARLGRSVGGRIATTRHRGGLATHVAVPVAIAFTALVAWATVAMASDWVIR